MLRKRYNVEVKLHILKCCKTRIYVKTRSHNPEVVGSSPASATTKTPDFCKKSGVFLTFGSEMECSKIPVGLAVGLAPKKGVLEKGEFQTIS